MQFNGIYFLFPFWMKNPSISLVFYTLRFKVISFWWSFLLQWVLWIAIAMFFFKAGHIQRHWFHFDSKHHFASVLFKLNIHEKVHFFTFSLSFICWLDGFVLRDKRNKPRMIYSLFIVTFLNIYYDILSYSPLVVVLFIYYHSIFDILFKLSWPLKGSVWLA